MSWDGMLPQSNCTRCGKPLNADGGHPAELYAGTYTGLCYACQNRGAYPTVREFDGRIEWSHPPHAPSWRRDRETFYGYADCPDPQCKGRGRILISRFHSCGGPYPIQCPLCAQRSHDNPIRSARVHFESQAAQRIRDYLESCYRADCHTVLKLRCNMLVTYARYKAANLGQQAACDDLSVWYRGRYLQLLDRMLRTADRRWPETASSENLAR